MPYIRIVCFSTCSTACPAPWWPCCATWRSCGTLYISIFSFFCNLGLNHVFIFGKLGAPALGVPAGATATPDHPGAGAGVVYMYMFHGQRSWPSGPGPAGPRDGLMMEGLRALPSLPRIAAGDTQWALVGLFKAAIIGRLGGEHDRRLQRGRLDHEPGHALFTQSLTGGACVVIGKSVGAGIRQNPGGILTHSAALRVHRGVHGAVGVLQPLPFTVSWYSGPVRRYCSPWRSVKCGGGGFHADGHPLPRSYFWRAPTCGAGMASSSSRWIDLRLVGAAFVVPGGLQKLPALLVGF